MNDELFDMELNTFNRYDVGTIPRWYRDIPLQDDFTIRIHILESGNMISVYVPGSPTIDTRLCNIYFAKDETTPGYLRPYPYVVNHNPATREALLDAIRDASEAAFEWCLWNLI